MGIWRLYPELSFGQTRRATAWVSRGRSDNCVSLENGLTVGVPLRNSVHNSSTTHTSEVFEAAILSYPAVPPGAAVLSICCLVGALAACTKAEDRVAEEGPTADTVATAPVTRESSAVISLADVAGKWKMRSTDESGGNVVVVELTATPDSSDWVVVGPDRPPVGSESSPWQGTASSLKPDRTRASS